ncbi:hypothetical protein J437_LFUL019258 [Ladona fulva]|uniref:Ion transport domain-containing protein n=1 Tax=Ladona fulva TaxID=123851 RepID=A0A8K0PDP3_LADFU|nr:hypothetical protein J437_LFUL019258 [Ladona fulva]
MEREQREMEKASRKKKILNKLKSFPFRQPAWGTLSRQNSLCERHHRPLTQQRSNVSSSSYPISSSRPQYQHQRNSLSTIVAAAADIKNRNMMLVESPPKGEGVEAEVGVASISGGEASGAGVPTTGPVAPANANGAAPGTSSSSSADVHKIKKIFVFFEPRGVRQLCSWFVEQKWFDNVVLLFIALNCITLAMERPNIPPDAKERLFLATANYIFTAVFALEMFIKVIATGMLYGTDAYFTSGWNIMDGSLVIISIVDLLMSMFSEGSPRIFGILRVFRLLRSLRPLRVINRAPGLKLVVQTLLSSLRPIGNIVLICCTFFIIFGILGVQLFKGAFFYCEGPDIKNVRNKTDCLSDKRNVWVNRKYNFDDLGKALMSLFVLSSKDGWVNIMYTGLDAVGVDQQPIENYSEWRLLYFISFLLLVGFFVLNMFVGVVVENFHRCREEQEKEEKARRALKRAKQMAKKRRKRNQPSYHANYSKPRLLVHSVVTSKYFDLAIAAVIGLNVVTMAMEFYMMPKALTYALKIFNYFFTAVFILESVMKLVALGFRLYFKDRWNQLDVGIVILSIVGIVLEELESKIIPINPTIIRVMRVLRIARESSMLQLHELRHRSASTSHKYGSQPKDCGRKDLWDGDSFNQSLPVPPAYPATEYSVYTTDASAPSQMNGTSAVYSPPTEQHLFLPLTSNQKAQPSTQFSGICNTISEEVSKATSKGTSKKSFLGLGNLQSNCGGDQSSPSDVSGLSPECTSPAVMLVPPPYPSVVTVPPPSCSSPCPYIPSSSSSSTTTSSPSSSYSHSRNSPCISPQEGEICLVVPDITMGRNRFKDGSMRGRSGGKQEQHPVHCRKLSSCSGPANTSSSSSQSLNTTPSPRRSKTQRKTQQAGTSDDNSSGVRYQEHEGNRVDTIKGRKREDAPNVVTKSLKSKHFTKKDRPTRTDSHNSAREGEERISSAEGTEESSLVCERNKVSESEQEERTPPWQNGDNASANQEEQDDTSDEGSQEDLSMNEDRRRLC